MINMALHHNSLGLTLMPSPMPVDLEAVTSAVSRILLVHSGQEVLVDNLIYSNNCLARLLAADEEEHVDPPPSTCKAIVCRPQSA